MSDKGRPGELIHLKSVKPPRPSLSVVQTRRRAESILLKLIESAYYEQRKVLKNLSGVEERKK